MGMSEQDFTLREKKFAKTKLTLLNEFITRLKTTKFADISIKEICDAAEVSEATFYNYYPQKKDVLLYHEVLMCLRISWILENEMQDKSPIELINEVYTIMASEIEDRNLFNEFITVMLAIDDKHCVKNIELSAAEKYFAYPDLEGIENITITNLEDIFFLQLGRAKEQKLIKEEIDIQEAIISLFSIMVGAPLCLDKDQYCKFKDHYQTQLKWFWKAVGSGGQHV